MADTPVRPREGSRYRGLIVAVLLGALLALYIVVVAERSVLMIRSGQPALVAMGAGILVVPILAAWFLFAEFRQAQVTSQMGKQIEAEGHAVEDTLPRSAAGRIDREAAREQFDPIAEHARKHPEDWRAWYNLGWAYQAAGDRRAARRSLIQAARLYRAERRKQRDR